MLYIKDIQAYPAQNDPTSPDARPPMLQTLKLEGGPCPAGPAPWLLVALPGGSRGMRLAIPCKMWEKCISQRPAGLVAGRPLWAAAPGDAFLPHLTGYGKHILVRREARGTVRQDRGPLPTLASVAWGVWHLGLWGHFVLGCPNCLSYRVPGLHPMKALGVHV